MPLFEFLYFLCVQHILFYILEIDVNFPDAVYIFIHHIGQFLQLGVRNTLTELVNPKATTYLNLELFLSQSLNMQSNQCNENASAYDSCIMEQYIDKLSETDSCILWVVAQPAGKKEIHYCDNYKDAIQSLQYFQNASSSCLTLCLLVISDLTLQLEDQYLSNNLAFRARPQNSLYLLLPKDVNIVKSQNVNTLFSALAQFLGIAGLFFGISVIGFADSMVKTFVKVGNKIGFRFYNNKYLNNCLMAVLALVLLALVIWIIIVFISKYTSFPVETNVALVTGSPPMVMALCRSKYITQNNGSSVTEDLSFWQDGVNIRKKIYNLSIMNSVGEWNSIWDSSMPTIQASELFSRIIFPLDNQTVQFCDMIDLQQYQDLIKVSCEFYSDLKFF